MSNELTTIKTENYLALQDGGDIAEAMAANLGEGNILSEGDLTRCNTPSGGSTKWIVPSITGDDVTDTITGILAYQCTRGILWAGDDPEEGKLPILVTDDLKVARMACDKDDVPDDILASLEEHQVEGGMYDWVSIPQNQWGSGKNGTGKQCKEQRVLFILREDDPLPIVVTIQPGSLKGWRKFIVDLSKAGVPYYRAVIALSLEKSASASGVAFAKITPALHGVLSKEEGLVVKDKFSKPLADIAHRVDVR